MTDIVERLRARGEVKLTHNDHTRDLLHEAIAEITRLREAATQPRASDAETADDFVEEWTSHYGIGIDDLPMGALNGLASRAAALLRSTPPAPAPDGWRLIETAPKDGTPIDVWVGGEFPLRLTNVEWRAPSDSEWWTHGGDTIATPDPAWYDQLGPLGKHEQPTHWMPLPPAPQPKDGEAGQ